MDTQQKISRGENGRSESLKCLHDSIAALQPVILRSCRRRITDEEDARDITAQTLATALANAASYRCGGEAESLSGWVHAILTITIADHFRREARRVSCQPEDLSPEAITDAEVRWSALEYEVNADVLAQIELRHEARRRLRGAALSPLAEACLLARIHGEKVRDTADRLGISIATACRHAHAAILRLRAYTPPEDAGPDAEEDSYLWRLATQVTIYRPPESTGSALSRERLKKMK